MTLEILLFVFAAVLMVAGIIGCIVPFLPGPPLSYVALLLVHFTNHVQFSTGFLVVWLVVVIVTGIIEYFIPLWGAKQFGGTKAGVWGSAIGCVAGMIFFPPAGIIIGTVAGAFIGEMLVHGADIALAVKSAVGALAGFVFGTALKLTVCLAMAFYMVKEIVLAVSN